MKRKIPNLKTTPRARFSAVSSPADLSVPGDFQKNKLHLSLWIMGVGMLMALLWNAFEGWIMNMGYPYNTFLFFPEARFNDFSDMTLDSSRSNPYLDPYAPYLPFAWLCLRPLYDLPYSFSLIACLFIGVAGLFLLLVRVLAIIPSPPWERVLGALLFLALSYPLIFCIDRGNIEIISILFVAGALYFFSRHSHRPGMLCLIPPIAFKLYPALFLILLFRQKRIALIAVCVAAFIGVTLLSLMCLSLPMDIAVKSYGRNMAFFTHVNFYENYGLGGSASLWNVYKIFLITMAQMGMIAPVDFSVDGSFIHISYAVYSCCSGVLAVFLAAYVCLVEKEFLRCVMVLLIFLSMATPTGADYRLLYANIACLLAILLKTRRNHDLYVLVLLALTMVPKKEIILSFAGKTESGFADVSLQVVLNPILLLAALTFLIYDSRATFDWRWSRMRLVRFFRLVTPRLPTKARWTHIIPNSNLGTSVHSP